MSMLYKEDMVIVPKKAVDAVEDFLHSLKKDSSNSNVYFQVGVLVAKLSDTALLIQKYEEKKNED